MAHDARWPWLGRNWGVGKAITMLCAVLAFVGDARVGFADATDTVRVTDSPAANAPSARSVHGACPDCHNSTQPRAPTCPPSWTATSAVCIRCHVDAVGPGHAYVKGHPVSIAYPLADAGFAPDALIKNAGLRLPDGKVECVTCHDVHDAAAPGRLRVEMTGSKLCLTCHRK
ncbi:MAG: cytochrome c3 family protein [Gemmatimonadetes bacterium]|nr:cytochrome c3 family protein [Gemmatimonadota bacterium]